MSETVRGTKSVTWERLAGNFTRRAQRVACAGVSAESLVWQQRRAL
ncbi:hypothetical protein VITFI_CDS1828 [Vitreoscilla filiformis]|uniref:Uncharacterized protein n=1 Tax=Vitreoscilla filiformis TaxID=63 RepID=A0A221KF20_VITFI|nr:hypothetical protein VITFI_CDS1828 [Vitreoscilla filiformis]